MEKTLLAKTGLFSAMIIAVAALAAPCAGASKIKLKKPAAVAQPFQNLPGVKDPAQQKDVQLDAVCTSELVKGWPSQFPERNGLAYRAYSCEEGNIAVGSNRPPNLIEYRKFKQYYQSN